MKKQLTALLLGIIIPVVTNGNEADSVILLNQVGYQPNAAKIALIRTFYRTFSIVNAQSGQSVYSGNLSQTAYWPYSGDSVRTADFSPVNRPGEYKLCIGENLCSGKFRIAENVYRDAAKAAIKAFYYNRCSFEITKEYGGKWARSAGHSDTAVIVHESAASDLRPAGTVISSPGGWYDAGDYNKYIVNSGITTYTLLLFYDMFPQYCKALNTNIPESKNDIPDVVDEILVNLRWMLTMQDPADGGVYHKLTNKDFDPFEMPNKSVAPRYVVMKTTAASLDFASVMAFYYRIFSKDKNPKLRSLAGTCLEAAKKAINWSKENPDIFYKQPKDITTGAYGDNQLEDEFFWASCEMALATNDPTLLSYQKIKSQNVSVQSWNNVAMLGMFSLALSDNPAFKALSQAASEEITGYADVLLNKYNKSAYKISLEVFHWGSNSNVANETLIQMIARKLSNSKKYDESIQAGIDYILGRNATGYCFMTGFGSMSPMNIHHRPSGSDGIKEPVPGFLVGGPTLAARNDCGDQAYPSKYPSRSYLDQVCSYSTNEIAINWNAPLFFILASADAEGSK